MNWRILAEDEQKVSEELVAVAVAYDDITAKLVQTYLIDHRVLTFTPEAPQVPLYPSIPQPIFIWVPLRKREEAVALLQELALNWAQEKAEEHA